VPQALGVGGDGGQVGSALDDKLEVPGLGARAGIDILVGLRDPADTDACLDRLQVLGYRFHFAKPAWAHLSGRGHKLHLTPLGSGFWTDHLLFRDYLRTHPDTAAAYHRLKLDLARTHGADGSKYVDGKNAFVRSVLERARQEGAAGPAKW
jgi:GrpB-like predicted nucleotidyltransferase (UPF0157 family)